MAALFKKSRSTPGASFAPPRTSSAATTTAYSKHVPLTETSMRLVLIVVGLVLLVAGLWVVFGHGGYQQTDTLVQFGSAKLTATHDKAFPQWLGIAGIVVGALLAIGGFFRKG